MTTPINRSQNTASPACLLAKVAAARALSIGANASVGYIAGSVFTIINPIGGAIFGATYFLTNLVTDVILGSAGSNNNTALKIAKFVISGVLGAVAATFAVASVGFPITFTAAALLGGGMALVSLPIKSIINCCFQGSTGLIGARTAIAITRQGNSLPIEVATPESVS
jgi:hypothetical protein